jgi:hypothetical protein
MITDEIIPMMPMFQPEAKAILEGLLNKNVSLSFKIILYSHYNVLAPKEFTRLKNISFSVKLIGTDFRQKKLSLCLSPLPNQKSTLTISTSNSQGRFRERRLKIPCCRKEQNLIISPSLRISPNFCLSE